MPRAGYRALGKGNLCRGPALGKRFFAEGRPSANASSPRAGPSVKAHLCRGPGPRQRRGSRRRGPWVMAALGVRLCRGPGVKPSAKRCQRPTFAEGPPACPRQCLSLSRVLRGPSAKIYLFFVFLSSFFCGIRTLFETTCQSLVYFEITLVYFFWIF